MPNDLDFSKVTWRDPSNQAQTIVLFLYGGACQLVGNMTNFDEIKDLSLVKYENYFESSDLDITTNYCWEDAGGNYIEDMLSETDSDGNKIMTLFRTCYSQYREDNYNKAHVVCVDQNQKGTFDINNLTSGGVITNIAKVLEDNGAVDTNTRLPFVSMEGETTFYAEGVVKPSTYLRAVSIDENLDNPYDISSTIRQNLTILYRR